jgi:hypothetical protein
MRRFLIRVAPAGMRGTGGPGPPTADTVCRGARSGSPEQDLCYCPLVASTPDFTR